jgi:hypothetical protein
MNRETPTGCAFAKPFHHPSMEERRNSPLPSWSQRSGSFRKRLSQRTLEMTPSFHPLSDLDTDPDALFHFTSPALSGSIASSLSHDKRIPVSPGNKSNSKPIKPKPHKGHFLFRNVSPVSVSAPFLKKHLWSPCFSSVRNVETTEALSRDAHQVLGSPSSPTGNTTHIRINAGPVWDTESAATPASTTTPTGRPSLLSTLCSHSFRNRRPSSPVVVDAIVTIAPAAPTHGNVLTAALTLPSSRDHHEQRYQTLSDSSSSSSSHSSITLLDHWNRMGTPSSPVPVTKSHVTPPQAKTPCSPVANTPTSAATTSPTPNAIKESKETLSPHVRMVRRLPPTPARKGSVLASRVHVPTSLLDPTKPSSPSSPPPPLSPPTQHRPLAVRASPIDATTTTSANTPTTHASGIPTQIAVVLEDGMSLPRGKVREVGSWKPRRPSNREKSNKTKGASNSAIPSTISSTNHKSPPTRNDVQHYQHHSHQHPHSSQHGTSPSTASSSSPSPRHSQTDASPPTRSSAFSVYSEITDSLLLEMSLTVDVSATMSKYRRPSPQACLPIPPPPVYRPTILSPTTPGTTNGAAAALPSPPVHSSSESKESKISHGLVAETKRRPGHAFSKVSSGSHCTVPLHTNVIGTEDYCAHHSG